MSFIIRKTRQLIIQLQTLHDYCSQLQTLLSLIIVVITQVEFYIDKIGGIYIRLLGDGVNSWIGNIYLSYKIYHSLGRYLCLLVRS